MECIYNKMFWCGEDQRCYNTSYGDLTGLDCTRPENYNSLQRWDVPARYAYQSDMFSACLTDYEPYPSTERESKVVANCSYYYNETTGLKVTGQPSRLIIDDQFLKSNSYGEEGARKLFSVEP